MSSIALAQIVSLRNGLDPILAQLEAVLSNAYLQSLPIVGTQLASAAAGGQQALNDYKTLETGVAAALDALSDPGGYAAGQITDAINAAIAKAGFAGAAAVTVSPTGTLTVQLSETNSATYVQPLGLDLGLPNLSVSASGSANATIGYALNLTASVDGSGTFAVAPAATPALQVTLDATAPTLSGDANVAALKFTAADTGSALHGTFSVDTAGTATFTGDASLALHLTSDLGSAALPSISADLDGKWHFASSTIDPANPAAFGDAPTIMFNNVSYDVGTFFDDTLKPILDKIAPVLAPIHNALAVFNTDLTFLKALFGPAWHTLDVAGGTDAAGNDTGDGKLTLLDLLKIGLKISGHDQNVSSLANFLTTLDHIVQIAAYLDGLSLGPASYNLGSFQILGDARQLGFKAADAAIGVLAPGQNLTTVLQGLGGAYAAMAPGSTQTVSAQLQTVLSDPSFGFPILNPANAFKLLLGATTDLVTVSPPTVSLNLGSVDAAGNPTSNVGPLFSIPVFPGVTVDGKAALQASFGLGFGYDSTGIQQFTAGGFSDPSKLLDGLFISNPATGPVLRVAGDVGLYVDVGTPTFGIAGGGDIGGDISFTLPGSGRAYLGPYIGTLLSDPLAAFNATGKITAGASIGLQAADVTLFGFNTPRITLASYNHIATPPVGPVPVVVQSTAITAIDNDTTVTTGRETPGHAIRVTVTFSGAIALPPSGGPVLQLNDNGTATIDTMLSKAAGANTLVFDYAVSLNDITLKTLAIKGVTGSLSDTGGQPVDLSGLANTEFPGLDIDTSEPREFMAPVGDFDVQANFNRAFVAVSVSGQDLTLYGNAIVDGGSTANFHQTSAELATLKVQAGGTLAAQRGILSVHGGLDDSFNYGTISVGGGADLRLTSTLHNVGTVALGDVAGTPTVNFLLDVNTLSGGGTILLSDSTANLIAGGPTAGTTSSLPKLINVDNTISGAGTIGGYAPDGSTGLDLVNQASIIGTGTNQLRLLATTTNTGLLSGTGPGGLLIQTRSTTRAARSRPPAAASPRSATRPTSPAARSARPAASTAHAF